MPQSDALASFVVFPPGPLDAEDLARVHVASWRETYAGLLPAAFLARMSEAGFARRFARDLADPRRGLTLAAADREGLVGYAAGGSSRRHIPGEAEIVLLYVLQRAQGRGVGRALLQQTARALQAEGAASLMISVLRPNHPARRFYEHLGGAPEPPRKASGPGGGVVEEIAYVWPDIRAISG